MTFWYVVDETVYQTHGGEPAQDDSHAPVGQQPAALQDILNQNRSLFGCSPTKPPWCAKLRLFVEDIDSAVHSATTIAGQSKPKWWKLTHVEKGCATTMCTAMIS